MSASLMHKGQERNERIGLRMATFLKRCGRDPETGQLLSLTGKKLDGSDNIVHVKSLEIHKKRQLKRHQWTPKLPRHHDAPGNSWHANLQDEDADIVFEEFRLGVEASAPETRKWYEPPVISGDEKQEEDGVHDEVSPMSAVGFVDDEKNQQHQNSSASPRRPQATIEDDPDREHEIENENEQEEDDEDDIDYYSPSAHRPSSASRSVLTSGGTPSRKEAHKLLAAFSASRGAATHNQRADATNTNEYQQALELSDVFLSQDTTRHVSYRFLKEDNRIHRVKTNQVIRGDGLDKITCGIPPEERKKIRPGRVEIVLPAAGSSAGQNQTQTVVVSRLVSHKQLQKEKLSHSVDFVAKYRQ